MTSHISMAYTGNPAFAGLLVSMLRYHGAEVTWTPPEEARDLNAAIEGVVVALVAHGSIKGIEAAVAQFRQRFPRAEVEIEDREEYDD